MALTSAQKTLIEQIGKAAQSYYPKYKIIPSLTIAQAILESGWGKSSLAKDCYNYFGMKWTSTCGCDYKEYSTKEQKSTGEYYTIKAKFRKYDSLAAGIEGYYKFLNYARYANLKGVTDYKKACELIRKDGWATSLTYTQNLVKLIETYDLTKYDSLNGTSDVIAATGYKAKVNCSALNVRNGAGTKYKINKVVHKGDTFTIVEEKSGWGKLKSGNGWVSLKYTKKV